MFDLECRTVVCFPGAFPESSSSSEELPCRGVVRAGGCASEEVATDETNCSDGGQGGLEVAWTIELRLGGVSPDNEMWSSLARTNISRGVLVRELTDGLRGTARGGASGSRRADRWSVEIKNSGSSSAQSSFSKILSSNVFSLQSGVFAGDIGLDQGLTKVVEGLEQPNMGRWASVETV
jgi:hypothetical protein